MTRPLHRWLADDREEATVIAVTADGPRTLGDLRCAVTALTTALLTRPGQRWALALDDGWQFLVALLALLHAGKTPVIPGHLRPSLLATLPVDETLSDISAETAPDAPLPPVAPHATLELYTSGSTGTPQRVVKSIASLDAEAALLAPRFAGRLRGCEVVGSVTPQHLYGLTFRIFLPMALGLPLHAAMLPFPEQLAALDRRKRYAFISSPAFLKRLDPALSPPDLALILSAGGAFAWHDVQHAAAWSGLWPDEIYGSSETGVLAWRQRFADRQPWQPFPGVTFCQQEAQIRVHSPLIADDNGLLLDDVLHFADDGGFHLGERRGRVVKIEEKRVSLADIEQRLLAIDGIREAAVVALSQRGRQVTGALLVLDAALHQQWQQRPAALEQAWRQALRPWLEPVAIPRCWRVVAAIPVNTMNKRVYAHLQEFFDAAP